MSQPEVDALRFVPIDRTHLDAVMAIEAEAYPEPWTRGMFLQEVESDRSYFYVMALSGQIIGYGGFWLVLDEAHITSVTVRDTHRGKGIGRLLMEFLLRTAREQRAHIATLEVRLSNLKARNLYLSLGFRPVGIRKEYYPRSGEDALVMMKELG